MSAAICGRRINKENPDVASLIRATLAVMTSTEMRDHERGNILAALAACNGKVFGPGGAAELLDLKPTTLASRMKVLGIAGTRARTGIA